jgi:hypothetical protein
LKRWLLEADNDPVVTGRGIAAVADAVEQGVNLERRRRSGGERALVDHVGGEAAANGRAASASREPDVLTDRACRNGSQERGHQEERAGRVDQMGLAVRRCGARPILIEGRRTARGRVVDALEDPDDGGEVARASGRDDVGRGSRLDHRRALVDRSRVR